VETSGTTDIQHGFKPGLIASDKATKAMPEDKRELQSTVHLFGSSIM